MSNMGDLDIVLSEYKLSDAQKNAIVELIGGGFETAKANTVKSLINKGLVEERLDGYSLSDSLADAVRPILERNKTLSETIEDLLESDPWGVKAVQDVMLTPDDREPEFTKVLDSDGVVKTPNWADPWKMGDAITADEAVLELAEYAVDPETGTEFNKFDATWSDSTKELAGFGATLGWKGTSVWDGLTAAEIKEDIKTAFPVNRKARREHAKMSRRLIKAAIGAL